jgi:hypothetical protein
VTDTTNPVDVDSFVEDGWVRLSRAVPPALIDRLLASASIHLTRVVDAVGWTLDLASVAQVPALAEVVTGRVAAAIDALVGPDRWDPAPIWGFPTRNPSATPFESVWHIDGDWFEHHLDSPEQVANLIVLWHDVTATDAPTRLMPGSHRAVARLIADHEPAGIPGAEIKDLIHGTFRKAPGEIVLATGHAGDVILTHPFLVHSTNPVAPAAPRRISNLAIQGRSPLSITAVGSPVERAIAQALP